MAKKNLSGRKTLYTKEMHDLVKAYARDGLTDKEICEKLNIGQTTFYAWQKRYPKFQKALKENKEKFDIKAVDALWKRVIGYDYYETETTEKDGKIVKTKKIKKHSPPDLTALIFWLKNRQPNKWRDKVIEFRGDGAMKELADALERSLDKK